MEEQEEGTKQSDDYEDVSFKLNFSAPKKFLQIYFNTETQLAKTIEISSPSIKVDWRNPKIYINLDEKQKPLYVHDFDFSVPSCIWSSSDSSTASSSHSESESMDEELWDIAVKERDKIQKGSSSAVYCPFRCINEFEFFAPSLTCLDVDDNPALPLFDYNEDMDKCLRFTRNFWCIFPPYFYQARKRASISCSDDDDRRRAFYGNYQELEKYALTV